MKIAFIGGGNMATALIAGLAGPGRDIPVISVCDPDAAARRRLEAAHGAVVHTDIGPAVTDADVIVLAVKPQVMHEVLPALATVVRHSQLVISVAAGVTVGAIAQALRVPVPVVRTMPNTPALLGAGVTGLFAGPACSAADCDSAQAILATVGRVVWIEDESLMDVVTALSGSGPAYFYLLAEAMRSAGIRLGLPPETANELAIHTAHGAGVMAIRGGHDIAELRRRVTSPNGTTQAALEVLWTGRFAGLIDEAIEAATLRGRELSGKVGSP